MHEKLLCLDAPLRKSLYNLALIFPQNAPHTQDVVTADEWDRPYSREAAAFPAVSTKLVSFLLPTSLPLKTDGRGFAMDLTLAHTLLVTQFPPLFLVTQLVCIILVAPSLVTCFTVTYPCEFCRNDSILLHYW